MTDWLGHLIAGWPIWLVIPILIVVAIVWFLINALEWPYGSSRKYEWPEDKKKRLQKQRSKKIMKVKKG
jgi:uncharacterized protein HemY